MAAATTVPLTDFASAERVPVNIVHQQARAFDTQPLTPKLLNSVLNYIFVLNPQRQIIFASQNVRQLTPDRSCDQLLGLRPGEALGCIHACEHTGGCGTSRFCSECGTVKAILASLAGHSDLQECRLTRTIQCKTEALDILVYASPFTHEGQTFSLFSVSDISHQKRRRVLERIFFHDVVNTAGALEGLLGLLKFQVPDNLKPELKVAEHACHDLLDQIQAQIDLTMAESNELVVAATPLNSKMLLLSVVDLFRNHEVAKERNLVVADNSPSMALISDATILKRVLGNLVKNALEAIRPGETVTLGCAPAGDGVQFTVHNPGVIPQKVQLQLFNRSFSTKGNGRGLGTYGAKLLTESYLKGTVGFESTPEQGTLFQVVLPKQLIS